MFSLCIALDIGFFYDAFLDIGFDDTLGCDIFVGILALMILQ